MALFTEFKLNQEMKDNVEKSVKKFNATMQSLDVDHLEYQKYTKSYVKKSGMGPDSLMQLAIQVHARMIIIHFSVYRYIHIYMYF